MIPLSAIIFWIFSLMLIAAASMVVTARNPVHSVLFLILAFFNAAGLFVLQDAEFLAMLLVVVYVGAVAVLFLFVVMMLDINTETLRLQARRYIPIGLIVAGIFFLEILMVVGAASKLLPFEIDVHTTNIANMPSMNNIEQIGNLLYTHYFITFQLAGLILLVAMIGAITLTLRHREGVKRQSISKQVHRRAKDEITLADGIGGQNQNA